MASKFFTRRAKFIDYIAESTDATTTEAQDMSGSIGSLAVLIIEVDNTNNSSTVVHAAIYDDGGDVNVGTDDPDILVRVQGGVKRQFICLTDEAGGPLTLSNVAVAAAVEAGAIGSPATSPTNDVIVRVGMSG